MRAVALVVMLGLAGPAWAQAESEPQVAPAAGSEQSTIDATKLGVSLSRIQKGLRIAETREKAAADGMRIEFQVQVYGEAPKIEVLKGIDLTTGEVPGSAPSHRQMFDYLTPQIYRSPTMPISAFAALAADWIWKRSKRSMCEEEIANYRALLMQGVNVSAPRCTQ